VQLHRCEHRTHLLVDGVDGLQGPDHHRSSTMRPVSSDDIDAIDVFAADGRLELEHGDVAGEQGRSPEARKESGARSPPPSR
jgi:hypothetical protein